MIPFAAQTNRIEKPNKEVQFSWSGVYFCPNKPWFMTIPLVEHDIASSLFPSSLFNRAASKYLEAPLVKAIAQMEGACSHGHKFSSRNAIFLQHIDQRHSYLDLDVQISRAGSRSQLSIVCNGVVYFDTPRLAISTRFC